jgi:uncharacterized membrane protein YadS
MGTLVKLVRVLMLGPVVLTLSLLTRRWRDEPDEAPPHVTAGDRLAVGHLPLHRLVPWYIAGFLVLTALRSADLLPHAMLSPMATAANLLTVIAALGLGTDLRTVARAGGRVAATAGLSLLVLGAISLGLIRLLGIARAPLGSWRLPATDRSAALAYNSHLTLHEDAPRYAGYMAPLGC